MGRILKRVVVWLHLNNLKRITVAHVENRKGAGQSERNSPCGCCLADERQSHGPHWPGAVRWPVFVV
jgi:hypothetical protein